MHLRTGSATTAGRPARSGAAVLVAAVLVLGAAGCDSVGERAGGVAEQAASEARARADQVQAEARRRAQEQVDEVRARVGDQVADRVQDAVREWGTNIDVERVCDLVADDRLTSAERGRLEVAVELGEALGLPAEVVGPASTILTTTTGATTNVDGMVEGCKDVGATLQDEA